MRNKLISRFERSIPAGGQLSIPCTGERIYVEKASSYFDFDFDGGGGELNQVKAGFDTGPIDLFSRINVFNRSSSAALKIVIWVSMAGARLNYNETPPTTPGVGAVGTLGPSDSFLFSGLSVFPNTVLGLRRKQIIITNLDSAGNLTVGLGGSCATTVFPLMALTLETDADVTVYNFTAGSISYQVLDLFYL